MREFEKVFPKNQSNDKTCFGISTRTRQTELKNNYPRPTEKMQNSEIAALRENINASQAVYAHYLNVSVKTVQAWEKARASERRGAEIAIDCQEKP
jgi:DNA-binding transcriptional regulator YiaG